MRGIRAGVIAGTIAGVAGGCAANRAGAPAAAVVEDISTPRAAAEWAIASARGTARPPFKFSREDDAFLEEVQRASFWYLWKACDPKSGMVRDRTSTTMVSVAGVGYQLAAIPIAIERGWITRGEGEERALRILRTLDSCETNRKAGLFYHFLDGDTARPQNNDAVSTIDSALLFAGMLVAGEYFGGETKQRATAFVNAADWSFFVLETPRKGEDYLKGFVSLGWKPKKFASPTGDGALLPYAWADAGDEQRLVCFLAAGAPVKEHGVDPAVYYRLRRMLGEHGGPGGSGVHVWFPWSGALFTHFFAHCFIDYTRMGADDPAAQGVLRRPRVDWWENSRRGVKLQRIKAMENPKGVPTLGANAWGLTASDDAKGYAVPGVYPERVATTDQIANVDYADFTPKDDFGDGTIAPYGAGCAIMFDPAAAMAALQHYRGMVDAQRRPLVWRDPGVHGETGEFGFRDSFNEGTGWVAKDCVAIDQGPLVLAIENARTGMVWKLFHRSEVARLACERLGLAPK